MVTLKGYCIDGKCSALSLHINELLFKVVRGTEKEVCKDW